MSLSGSVLVLNQDYQPLTICSVRKSLLLIFSEKVETLHVNLEKRIRTVRHNFAFPSVIRLKRYAPVPYQRMVLTRKNILKRDRHRCQYCGSIQDLTIDHIVPRSRGGEESWENLVTACNRCNNKKGNRTPKEAGILLKITPYRPSNVMFLRTFSNSISEDWKPYLYM